MATPRLALILLKWGSTNCIEHPVNAIPSVFSADPQNFQTDVVELSNKVPVIVLFWAQQMPETVAVRAFLDSQVNARAGRVALALVDVALDQTLAQHLRVQTLPSIRVVKDGQLLEQLDGPQPEEVLLALCDRLTLSGAEMLQEQLGVLLETKDFDGALNVLYQAIDDEPGNPAFRVELADVLVLQGNLLEAKSVLAGIDQTVEGSIRPRSRLSLAEEAAGMDSLDELLGQVEAKPDDLNLQYCLAIRLATEGRIEEALECSLGILCADRKYRDDIGRLTMLRIFDLLPKGDELATSFRRRMFNFMH